MCYPKTPDFGFFNQKWLIFVQSHLLKYISFKILSPKDLLFMCNTKIPLLTQDSSNLWFLHHWMPLFCKSGLYTCVYFIWVCLPPGGVINFHFLRACGLKGRKNRRLENGLQPHLGSLRTDFLSNLRLLEQKFDSILLWNGSLEEWKQLICDRPPQTSRKVGIFYSELQGKIHGKVVFWQNWDFKGFEMFISFLKLLAKYQVSFLLQNIWKLTFSRCSCTGNVYKMKMLRHIFLVLRILTCHASKIHNSTSGCRITWHNYQFKAEDMFYLNLQ